MLCAWEYKLNLNHITRQLAGWKYTCILFLTLNSIGLEDSK